MLEDLCVVEEPGLLNMRSHPLPRTHLSEGVGSCVLPNQSGRNLPLNFQSKQTTAERATFEIFH